ncbi:hypothetical protein RvY_17055 [Ramazzottius varieornatus]|uniref:Uncharacterized protein n=1 Tax=Ramazzottius varieornatus TaxID=947166 RepID=A0A1D1W0R4_RAMVA|nr:hypothetical protein RvY_17055 [Ramazzottius varieornatus]
MDIECRQAGNANGVISKGLLGTGTLPLSLSAIRAHLAISTAKMNITIAAPLTNKQHVFDISNILVAWLVFRPSWYMRRSPGPAGYDCLLVYSGEISLSIISKSIFHLSIQYNGLPVYRPASS